MALKSKLLMALALTGVMGSGVLYAGSLGTIVLNGTSFPLNSFSVTTEQGSLVVRATHGTAGGDTGGSGGDTGDTGGSGGDTGGSGGDTGDTGGGGCGPLPSNVVEMNAVPWGVTTPTTRYALSGEIKAFPFTTSSGGRFVGRFDTAMTSTNPRMRSIWISECPGGAPLPQERRGSLLCQSLGYEVASLRWSEPGGDRICSLESSTRYYVNVRSADTWNASESNCGGSRNCPFYLQSSVN